MKGVDSVRDVGTVVWRVPPWDPRDTPALCGPSVAVEMLPGHGSRTCCVLACLSPNGNRGCQAAPVSAVPREED